MPSRAIKPKRDDTILSNWESSPERAPSIIQEESPTLARLFALAGLVLVALGGFAVLAPFLNRGYVIGPATGGFALSIGLLFLVFHALVDRDVQYRLMYLIMGFLAIGVGVVLRLLPFGGTMGGLFLSVGLPAMVLGLVFVLAAVRHETEANVRLSLTIPLAILGFVMVVLASFAGHLSQQFLMPEGILISLVGLVFIAAFLGTQQPGTDTEYNAGLALGLVGLVGLAAVLARTILATTPFFVPAGLVLLSLALLYLLVALCVCTDWPVLVMFRRELRAFFFSPIGHLVILGNVFIAWIWFYFFFRPDVRIAALAGGMLEPIVRYYLFNFVVVIAQIFIVPALTMRLFSEEKKSGTLEVLLTAPVSESSIVLGKFAAAFAAYLFTWLPWFAFLLALRLFAGTDFEYRPLLSFLPALMATGMGFLAIGVFFSSVTSNQIIAAVLTFVAMILQMLPFSIFRERLSGSIWGDVLDYISPLDLWGTSLHGVLAPRFFLYHISVAVFFLFLTTKVLEARKWS